MKPVSRSEHLRSAATHARLLALLAACTVAFVPVDAGAGSLIADRPSGETAAGLAVAIGGPEEAEELDAVLTTLWGEVAVSDRVTVYLEVPIHALFVEGDAENYDVLGNIEVGTTVGFVGESAKSLLRLGLVLPSSNNLFEMESHGDLYALAFSIPGDMTNWVRFPPDFVTARLSYSAMIDGDAAFFRGDLGFDLMLPAGSEARDETVQALRGNVGGGAHLGPVDLMAELGLLLVHWDSDAGYGVTPALGLAYNAPYVRPKLGVSFPFGEQLGVNDPGDVYFVHVALDITAFAEPAP